jgi:hypothetical protein
MFIVNSGSEALPEVKRKLFHSKTAKSLYLAKRACPDILTTVIFFMYEVQGAMFDDKVLPGLFRQEN